MAYGAGVVGGSFTAKNKLPTVNALVAPDMTPQAEWTTITVTVEDKNKIIDVQEVHVEVFYDSVPSDPVAPGAANVQTCGILTWDRGTGWSIAPGATTWAINAGGCSKPLDTVSSGDWVFSFKVGKVATESPGADNWDAYAKARDNVGWGTTDLYDRDQEMFWYGEVTAITTDVGFGDVDPGTGFGDNVNEQTGISINYISNGAYDEQVKSSATWAGATYTATFDQTGACANADEFSLKAEDSDSYGTAAQVTLAGATIDDTGTQTTEAGDTVATNTLWLRLADVFHGDTYTGTITYIIADGS